MLRNARHSEPKFRANDMMNPPESLSADNRYTPATRRNISRRSPPSHNLGLGLSHLDHEYGQIGSGDRFVQSVNNRVPQDSVSMRPVTPVMSEHESSGALLSSEYTSAAGQTQDDIHLPTECFDEERVQNWLLKDRSQHQILESTRPPLGHGGTTQGFRTGNLIAMMPNGKKTYLAMGYRIHVGLERGVISRTFAGRLRRHREKDFQNYRSSFKNDSGCPPPRIEELLRIHVKVEGKKGDPVQVEFMVVADEVCGAFDCLLPDIVSDHLL